MKKLPTQTLIYARTSDSRKFLSRKVRETETYYCWTDKDGKDHWVGKSRCEVVKDAATSKQIDIIR